MLKSITATNPKGESLTLELLNPSKNGLAIREIKGLGPPKADINHQELATADGGVYTGSRTETRNIVIDLIMMESPTIEDARLKTYRYFPIKKPVQLHISTDRHEVDAVGYVESNEPDIFSEQESCQISIICTDPYFYQSGDSATVFAGVQPKFEFEFPWEDDDEFVTVGEDGYDYMEMGRQLINTRAILEYEGDVDTGVLIEIEVLDVAEDIRIFNDDTKESFQIDTVRINQITGSPLGAGDWIYISTKKTDKYVKLLRNGVYINIISAVNRDSDWFQVSTGINTFWYTTKVGSENLSVSFIYKNAYGGI